MELKNKVVVITGASSGIGKEAALLFGKAGSIVILTSRTLKDLEAVEKEIVDSGGKAESYVMNTTDKEQVAEVIREIIANHSTIDVLVNNAGIARWADILDVTHEDFEEQVQVNLLGYFYPTKEVCAQMVQQGSGCIINVISSTVKNTKSKRVAYAASKYGQAGLSNAAHEDLKDKGVSVIAVYPGKTSTPIHDLAEEDPQRKEMLDPKDVAQMIVDATQIPLEDDVKELIINP